MKKSEIIEEIRKLHSHWEKEFKAEGMEIDIEILSFHAWLSQNHSYLIRHNKLKPEGSHQRVAMIVRKQRDYLKIINKLN